MSPFNLGDADRDIARQGRKLRMRSNTVIALFLAILAGMLLGLGACTFLYAKGYAYLTNDPAACTNCHVMQAQFDGWVKSSHRHAAACNDCHTPHNFFGKYAVKVNNGFWHSFYFTTGWFPDVIEITKFDHQITESACRRCHQNITAAIDGDAVHGDAKGLQCTRCHSSVGHSETAAKLKAPAFLAWEGKIF
jgi:cytochrome c nitrite reductase small subunit